MRRALCQGPPPSNRKNTRLYGLEISSAALNLLADSLARKGLVSDDNAIKARQRLVAEQEEARQPLREANAKRIAKLTRAIESDALGIQRRLRRADRAGVSDFYQRLGADRFS